MVMSALHIVSGSEVLNPMRFSALRNWVVPVFLGICAWPAAAQTPDDPEITFLASGANAPMSGESLPHYGMAIELLEAALELAPQTVSHEVTWESDRDIQRATVLNSASQVLGVPFFQPDCSAVSASSLCTRVQFSDPLIRLPVMLFVQEGREFEFDSDADIIGRTLCRPEGYPIDDLDGYGRRWVSERRVEVVSEDDVEACFARLSSGGVDAVAVDLFLGAQTIRDMKLQYEVFPLERPLSHRSLHVVAAREFPHGREQLDLINAGLARLKEGELYQDIVTRHLDALLPEVDVDRAQTEDRRLSPVTDGEFYLSDVLETYDGLVGYVTPDHAVALPPAVSSIVSTDESHAETPIAELDRFDPRIDPHPEERVAEAVPRIDLGVITSPRPLVRPDDLVAHAAPAQRPRTPAVVMRRATGNIATGSSQRSVPSPNSERRAAVALSPRVTPPAQRQTEGAIRVVGVFDLGRETWGLVRLPNGDIREFRPGQRIGGVTIESINGRSIRVRSGTGPRTLRTGDSIAVRRR